MDNVLCRAKFFCRRYFKTPCSIGSGVPRHGLLVEFSAARNVFLRHDRLSGSCLFQRLGSIPVLPVSHPSEQIHFGASRLVDLRISYPAAPCPIADNLYTPHGGTTACFAGSFQGQINRMDLSGDFTRISRECDLAPSSAHPSRR